MDADLIKRAVTVAGRAPSLHNSQPWLWLADGAQLQLHLEPGRLVHNTDTAGREALLSCGAMLDHLRVAMSAAGWASTVERFPDPDNPDHLASVNFTPATNDVTAAHADAILSRRTDRLPFQAPTREDVDVLVQELRGLLDADAVRLDVLPEELRDELVEASRLADRMRRYDELYQAELDWWTSPFEFDEGIPRSALNSVPEADRVDLNRSFPASTHAERRRSVQQDQAAILVLSTPGDTAADALACGEALSAVLLECTVAGLATCTVSHLTELESARKVVGTLIGTTDRPQVLIRVGRIPELERRPSRTPRRAPSDILRFRR